MVGELADKVTLELEAKTQAYRSAVAKARSDFDRDMNAMVSSANSAERQVTAAGKRMNVNLARYITAFAVARAIKDVQELADTWTEAGNKLAAAGVPMEKVASTQDRLANTARDTRSEYASTANTFARLTRATEDLNASEAQRLRATELINKATKAGGATTQEQISTIVQLTQALASGSLQGDELRSIRENSPLIAKAIATEFGVTIGQLKNLGKEGKLTSDRVFKAILDYGPKIDSQFARTRATIGESFQALETEAGRFLSKFDQATGASSGIAAFVSKAADNFDILSQAVIVAGATVAAVMTGRFAQSMATAAVSNEGFVRSLMNSKLAMELESDQARKAARDKLLLAQAARDDSRAEVVATQAKIVALREEADAYRTNIALATAQQRVAAQQATTGRSSSGTFVSRTDARGDQNTATKALIANRMQLTRVSDQLLVEERNLSAQHQVLGSNLQLVSVAQSGMRAALVGTSVAARAAQLAVAGLTGVLDFFGGPIGVAITVVGAAMAYLATEAAKAKVASSNAQSVLDELENSANLTKTQVSGLAQSHRDQGKAASDSASASHQASSAYDAIAASAANAAESVKYLTAQQRLNALEKIRDARRDLEKAETGSNPFLTNGQEALANSRQRLIKLGTGATTLPGFAGDSDLLAKSLRDAANPKASKELQNAAQEYRNQIKLRAEAATQIKELKNAEDIYFKAIDDPTQTRPKTPTNNLVTPSGSGSGSGSGSKRGRKGKSPEDIALAREELRLENESNVAQAAGADELAQFLQDRIDYLKTVKKLMAEGLGITREQAEAEAAQYIEDRANARDRAKLDKDQAEAAKEAKDAQEDAARATKDMLERNAYLKSNELQVELELARLAGNSDRVKELERILALNQRIAEYQTQGGLNVGEATKRATADQNSVNKAEDLNDLREPIKEVFRDGARAAFDGDLGNYLSSWFKDAAARGVGDALDSLVNALVDVFKTSIGGSSGGSGAFGDVTKELFKSFFGGKRAGGGQMTAGHWYMTGENGPEPIYAGTTAKAFPNSTLRAAERSSGGGGGAKIQVVNATGVAATARSETKSNGDIKLTLEPLMDDAIAGQGRKGNLAKGLKATPKPARRA